MAQDDDEGMMITRVCREGTGIGVYFNDPLIKDLEKKIEQMVEQSLKEAGPRDSLRSPARFSNIFQRYSSKDVALQAQRKASLVVHLEKHFYSFLEERKGEGFASDPGHGSLYDLVLVMSPKSLCAKYVTMMQNSFPSYSVAYVLHNKLYELSALFDLRKIK